MELILIRHFQTPGNRLRQYIGSTDEDLDMDEVKKRGSVYPNVDVLISSPMKRCIQTAAILYPEIKPILCEDLRECDFGLFEGKSYEELKDLKTYQCWLESGGVEPFPEGESRVDFQARCIRCMKMLVDEWINQGNKRVAVVVHGGTIMSVLSAFDREKRGFYEWQIKNGEGYQVQIKEQKWKQGRQYFEEIEKLCFK